MRVFLLNYNNILGTYDQVKEWVDKSPLILFWRYELPNCFYVVSEGNSQQIAEAMRQAFPNQGMLLVTELLTHFPENNYYGYASDDTWHLLRHKYPKNWTPQPPGAPHVKN